MKLNDQYTAPDQRFFYPVNHGIEHHSSLDIDSLPRTESTPGLDHYAVVKDGLHRPGEVSGAQVQWCDYNLPVGATVLGIAGQGENMADSLYDSFVTERDMKCFGEENFYLPGNEDDVRVMVKGRISGPSSRPIHFPDERFNPERIAILPQSEPLPGYAEMGIPDSYIRYQLLGFIGAKDQLVTWHSQNGMNAQLVDLSVANRISNTALEKALLFHALPQPTTLTGLLGINAAARTYLHYYDEKYGTNFLPRTDPLESGMITLSDEDHVRYRKLIKTANFFMSRRRDADPRLGQ